jgi:hypothetical protein
VHEVGAVLVLGDEGGRQVPGVVVATANRQDTALSGAQGKPMVRDELERPGDERPAVACD